MRSAIFDVKARGGIISDLTVLPTFSAGSFKGIARRDGGLSIAISLDGIGPIPRGTGIIPLGESRYDSFSRALWHRRKWMAVSLRTVDFPPIENGIHESNTFFDTLREM